jgi:hypothetical protein
MARWLARDGAAVRVWDSRVEPPQGPGLRQHVPQAELIGGPLDADALAGVDRVFKSPGLAPGDERIAAVLAAARAAKLPVQGELELFAAALESLRTSADYSPKVIAVTGTNGKTTTTALTALLVERSGKRVAAAGNIGPTMLQTLADAIDAGPAESLRERLPEVWVLELSSFQLAGSDASGFEPDAAALLNVSEDHLDWHGSMADYAAAKARVFGTRATIVVNRDDDAVMRLVPAPKTLPARKGRVAKVVARRVVTFGCRCADARRRLGPGDRERHGVAGPRPGRRGGERRRRDRRPAPDAGRRAAHPRPPQRHERARRAGAGERDRLPARADAARAARVPRRAASRRACRFGRTASTPSTTARAPTSARPRRRSSASAASARRPSWSSSSAATARARTSRRSPRR